MNEHLSKLLPIFGREWVSPDRLHLRNETDGDRPIYYTHKGRITNVCKRLRLSMPYTATEPQHDETVFTANGKRYPYPGALDLPSGYERNDAAMTAAEFTGEPDDRTPFYLARQAADREGLETRKRNGVTLIMQMKGQAGYFGIAADTLLAIGAVIEACGADSPRMYTQPHLGHTLVTVRVGIVLVQFMPMPVPADIVKDPLACWRIDNPQLPIA